jgi:hypothetical protein
VQPVRRQPPRAADARRIASSSAWDVGSPVASRSLAATARTSSPLATTAPTGTSPFPAASLAASRARRIIARSVSENCCDAVSTTEPMIAVRDRTPSQRTRRSPDGFYIGASPDLLPPGPRRSQALSFAISVSPARGDVRCQTGGNPHARAWERRLQCLPWPWRESRRVASQPDTSPGPAPRTHPGL